jgi:hypothetical protein
MLVAAFRDEDAMLRHGLQRSPHAWRDRPGPGGRPALKDLLGHITFWDDFTVEFFTRKLASEALAPGPPLDFEKMSREAVARFRAMPYGEVLGRYLEATAGIIAFVSDRWDELTWKQQHDFWTPLRHRRGHRLHLEAALERWAPETGQEARAADG